MLLQQRGGATLYTLSGKSDILEYPHENINIVHTSGPNFRTVIYTTINREVLHPCTLTRTNYLLVSLTLVSTKVRKRGFGISELILY